MIAVLDYDAGNLTSVACAVRHLGFVPTITRDPRDVRRAGHVIFPGVGAAGASMATLRALGLDAALHDARRDGKPILGICIGCQVAFTRSEEDAAEGSIGTPCLGLLAGDVVRFRFPNGVRRKVPHMGWNEVHFRDSQRAHPVIAGIDPPSHFYFVHGYHVRPADPACVVGEASYGEVVFPALVADRNLVAAQFHVEKSGPLGLRLLENFLRWKP